MSDFFNNSNTSNESIESVDSIDLNDTTDTTNISSILENTSNEEIDEFLSQSAKTEKPKANSRSKDAWICETKYETERHKTRKNSDSVITLTPKKPFTPEVITEVQKWLIAFENGSMEIPSHKEKYTLTGELIQDSSNTGRFCYKKLFCTTDNCPYKHSYATLFMRAFVKEFYTIDGVEEKEETLSTETASSYEDDIYNLREQQDVVVKSTYKHAQSKVMTAVFTPRENVPPAVVNILSTLIPNFYAGKTYIPRIGIYEAPVTAKVFHCNGAICYNVVCAKLGDRKLKAGVKPEDDPTHVIHDCRKFHNNDTSLVALIFKALLNVTVTKKNFPQKPKKYMRSTTTSHTSTPSSSASSASSSASSQDSSSKKYESKNAFDALVEE